MQLKLDPANTIIKAIILTIYLRAIRLNSCNSYFHNKTNTVFIAGGTGITPFLSLFTHESFKEYINPKIYLGFRTEGHNIYEEELSRMMAIRDIRPSADGFVKSYNQDTDGVIDIEKIFDQNGVDSNYFISGPPVMIKLFKQSLIQKGVPAGNVLTDDWE